MTPENPVVVENEALAAEAAAIPLPEGAGAAPSGEAAAPAPDGQLETAGQGGSWSALTPGIVEGVDLFVCPNWQLTDPEKAALAESLGPALDQLFPGGIGDDRWAPYFRVLVVAGGIAAMRYDRDTGKLRPLRSGPAAPPIEREGMPGGFSTGAGAGSH